MRNYFSLPQFNPGDQRINTAPVQNALESWGQTTRQNELFKRQAEEQQYQRGRDQKQDARADETYKMQALERLGKSAFAYSQLPPEKRDPTTWGRMVKGMQAYDPSIGTDPDDMDPIAGPAKFAAVYGGMVRDPREDKLMDLKIRGAEADITKTLASAKKTGSDFGKTGTTVVGPDGKYYVVRYKADGTEVINPLEVGGAGVTPFKGVDVVGDEAIDKATGAPIRSVGDALRRGEAAKVEGREFAEGKAKFPKVERGFRSAQIDDKNIFRSLDKAEKMASPWTTGFVGSIGQYIKGSGASDLAVTLRQVDASMGFGALQEMRDNSPTGGALGAVTERELELLRSAKVAIDQAQSEAEFRESIAYIREIKTEYAALRRQAYEEDKARFGAAAVPNPETGAAPASGGAPDFKSKYGLE